MVYLPLICKFSVAGFCARMLLTAWSACVLWRTHSKKSVYQELIGASATPCSADLFNEDYFRVRNGYEVSTSHRVSGPVSRHKFSHIYASDSGSDP